MAGIDPIYRLVKQLTPNQRREILIDLKATGKRSGGKMHTYTAMLLICEHDLMDDVSLRGHLPDDMKHVLLRHIKARLMAKILNYLQVVSEDPEIKMLRIKANISLLVRMGIVDGLMKMLKEAKAFALEAGRTGDAAELGFLLYSEQARTDSPTTFEETAVPEATLALAPLALARAYELYYASQKAKSARDTMEAARWIETSEVLLEDCIFPLERALVLKARYNLLLVQRNLIGALDALRALIQMFEPVPLAGLEVLALQRPLLLRYVSIIALEVGNRIVFEDARGRLSLGVKQKGPLQQDYLVSLCWVEMSYALAQGPAKSAETKVKRLLDQLKEQGHTSHAELPSILLQPLALNAYHAKDYVTSASTAAKYLLRLKPKGVAALTFYLIRLISQVQLADAHMVGLVAREALAGMKGNREAEKCLLLFQLLAKVENANSLHKGIISIVDREQEIKRVFEQPEWRDLSLLVKLRL